MARPEPGNRRGRFWGELKHQLLLLLVELALHGREGDPALLLLLAALGLLLSDLTAFLAIQEVLLALCREPLLLQLVLAPAVHLLPSVLQDGLHELHRGLSARRLAARVQEGHGGEGAHRHQQGDRTHLHPR